MEEYNEYEYHFSECFCLIYEYNNNADINFHFSQLNNIFNIDLKHCYHKTEGKNNILIFFIKLKTNGTNVNKGYFEIKNCNISYYPFFRLDLDSIHFILTLLNFEKK